MLTEAKCKLQCAFLAATFLLKDFTDTWLISISALGLQLHWEWSYLSIKPYKMKVPNRALFQLSTAYACLWENIATLVWSVLGQSEGSPWVLVLRLLWYHIGMKKEKPQPHISTKKQPSGCNTYKELLGGSKSIPSKPLSHRYSSDLTTTKFQSYSKIYLRALFLATTKVLHAYTLRGKTVKIPPTGRTLAAEWWEMVSTYMDITPSLYLILFCLWLHRHSFSSGWKSNLQFNPMLYNFGVHTYLTAHV